MGIKFDGEFSVPVSQEEAYALLSDPQKFGPLLPTYKSLEMQDEQTAIVKVKVGIGKVRGTATIALVLEEEEPPTRAAYAGKGKIMGGAFNMATAFELESQEDSGTLVKWEGELNLFGKLVSLAGGLIRPLAKKDIERLIDALQAALTPAGEQSAAS
ncbi:MAG: SRPBCC domain-containing protein [Gammaproteobacteria bacterium]|nr:SRPBCC domain-containing protein [Gammaproteobacteria bacterium]